ncbi:sugar ABC transporter ATP-binding protein [Nocardioides terrisoli]|uniref:sugar ABC transporter ATP-binding protein n=1 Tax=Nocardioides terrisoli TaxID=3388267 RepID=UPI00287B88AC|nr:sugar ABC transporter ATP-binding protein [Nocardioides marmorisolisilvae]
MNVLGDNRTGKGPARVRLGGISKRYPGTVALDDVSLEVRPGEIHALIGGNGSGKSTLIKVLCGVISSEPGGTITLDGAQVSSDEWSADHAHAAGVHAVHQDLGVFLDMSVAENLAIGEGFALKRVGAISWPDVYGRADHLLERFQIAATPQTPMRSLSQSNRTLVAIARAVQDGAHDRGLLILDEPTAALAADESNLLLGTLRRFASVGQSILYVSHRLDEILRVADRVTVLRDGRATGTHEVNELDEKSLIRLIVGSDIATAKSRPRTSISDDPVLELNEVSVGPLRSVDLTIRGGEIVGVAGLVGSGRSSLLRGVFGECPLRGGTLTIAGEKQRFSSCRQAIKSGVAYVPENRADDAAFVDLSIAANIVMPSLHDYRSAVGIRDHAIVATARRMMGTFHVKADSEDALLATLSGGNQQKVILARWLRMEPLLLLLDEPTQGVDVGARAEIHDLIRRAADDGMAVLMVASDPEELAQIVDRALVLQDGEIGIELSREEVTVERLTEEIHRGQKSVA